MVDDAGQAFEPQIDILMATYNGERYLDEQICSIITQTYTNWRLIISDDSSSDRTPEIIKRYASADPRISVCDAHNRFGAAKDNFMYLLGQTNADYFMFCDQDDLWLPEKIEKSLKFAQIAESEAASGAPVLVFGDVIPVDEKLEPLARSFFELTNADTTDVRLPRLVLQNIVIGCTVLGNASLREKMLLSVPHLDQFIMHDWIAALIVSACGKLKQLDEPLMLYRQHGNNSVGVAGLFSPKSIKAKLGAGITHGLTITQKQARAFLDTFGATLSGNDLDFLQGYSTLDELSVAERGALFSKHACWNHSEALKMKQRLELAIY